MKPTSKEQENGKAKKTCIEVTAAQDAAKKRCIRHNGILLREEVRISCEEILESLSINECPRHMDRDEFEEWLGGFESRYDKGLSRVPIKGNSVKQK